MLLYLPLNAYAGQLTPDLLRKLVTDGTFYHLWYFPALLVGVPLARALRRLGPRAALAAAGALYLIGLGGDSYYGLAVQLSGAERFYGAFFHLFSYTRNGLFFAPLFLLLGAAGPRPGPAAGRVPGALGVPGPDDRRGLLAAEPGCPAPRQHVRLSAAGHGVPVLLAAGRERRGAAAAAVPVRPCSIWSIPGASSWSGAEQAFWAGRACWWRTAWAISQPCCCPAWPCHF